MAFTLDAMSIYGQDTRMLDSIYYAQDTSRTAMISTSPDILPDPKPPSRCLLLALPLEIRQQIYMHVLPRTYDHPSRGIVWLRGTTNLLATNSQIHNEAIPFLYSANTFLIDVSYDCSTFRYQWSLPSSLFPKRRLAFPEDLGDRYIALLRKIQVSIHIIDQYTGMIKFNYGGSGLMNGFRDQVQFLRQSLSRIPEIRCLDIRLQDDTHTDNVAQRVLGPILELENIRQGTVTGNIEPIFRESLLLHLNRKRKAMSLSDLPYELRRQIYSHLLPSHNQGNYDARENESRHRHQSSRSGLIALSYTNHHFYAEVQAFIFQSSRLKLSIYQDLTYSFGFLYQVTPSRRQRGSLPISSFQDSLYRPAVSHLRWLSISLAYIPLAKESPRFKALENFLDTLINLLQTATLNLLEIDYVVRDSRSSEGDSPNSSTQPLSNLSSSVRSLDLGPNNNQTPQQASSSNRAMELSLAQHCSRVTAAPIVASPTTASPTHHSSQLLQTPPILYLVAKFNPVMAKVKTRKNGHVSVRRRSQHSSSTEDYNDRLTSRNNFQRARIIQPSLAETSIDVGEHSTRRRAHRNGSPLRTDVTKSRSTSSKRRSRGAYMLFTDVPI